MRLWEEEESKNWNQMVLEFQNDPDKEIDWGQDWSAVYRFKRFFDTIKGFHSVGEIISVVCSPD